MPLPSEGRSQKKILVGVQVGVHTRYMYFFLSAQQISRKCWGGGFEPVDPLTLATPLLPSHAHLSTTTVLVTQATSTTYLSVDNVDKKRP